MTQYNPNPNGTSTTTGWSHSGGVTLTATADGLRIQKGTGTASVYSPSFNPGGSTFWLTGLMVRRNTATSRGFDAFLCQELAGVWTWNAGDIWVLAGTTAAQNQWIGYPRSPGWTVSGGNSARIEFKLPSAAVDITIKNAVVHNAATAPANNPVDSDDAAAAFVVPTNSLTITAQQGGNNDAVNQVWWDWGHGGGWQDQQQYYASDLRIPALTHTFPAQGTYQVRTGVYGPSGNGDPFASAGQYVTVPSGTFTANFTFETDYLLASFDASSSSYPANSAPTTYTWNFGDGSPLQSGPSKYASHTYATAGSYSVGLTISTAIRSHTTNHPVTVVGVPGSALDFTIQADKLHVEMVCQTPGAATPTWNFGDGNTGTGLTATHTYATAGTYVISMTVDGVSTTRSVTVTEDYVALNIPDALRLEVEQDLGEVVAWNRVPNPSGALGAAGWTVSRSTSHAKVTASALGLTLTSGADSPNIPQAYTARMPILLGRWAAASVNLLSISAGCYARLRLEFADATGAIVAGSNWTPYLNTPGRVQTTPTMPPTGMGIKYAVLTVQLTGAASETAPATGKTVTWRQAMAATSLYEFAVTSMPYGEGQPWTDILGPTHEISISRNELDVSTLHATVLDSELDPAIADTIRPGARARLRVAVDNHNGTQSWEPLYTGRLNDAQVTYSQSELEPTFEEHTELSLNPTIISNTNTYQVGSPATLTATASGGKVVVAGANTTAFHWAISFKFLVNRDRRYRIKWRGRRVSGTGGFLYMRLRAFAADGPDLGVVYWDRVSPSPATHVEEVQVGSGTLNQWVDTECVLEPGVIPAGAENINLWWTPTAASGQAPNGEWTVTNVSVVEEWTPPARPVRQKSTKVTLTAWDAASDLANTGQPSGVAYLAEIPSLMAGSPIPVTVDGQTGTTAAPTVVAVNDNATLIDQIVAARDTQLGYAHVSRAGALILNTPAGVPTVPLATVDESVYSTADVQFSTSDAINSLIVKWVRLDAETRHGPYEDAASIQRWGLHRQEVTWQGLTEDEPTIAAQAATLLAANAVPIRRVHQVQIPIRNITDLTPARALLDLMDLITVRHERTDLDAPLRITEIQHKITARAGHRSGARWQMLVGFAVDGSAARPIPVPSPPPAAPGLPHGEALGLSNATPQSLTTATITKVTTAVLTSVTVQGGITWSGANNRFVVAKDGVYMLHGRVAWSGNAAGTRLIYLYKNGVNQMLIATPPPSATAMGQALTAPLKLAAGDYIELFAYQSSGGNLTLINNAGNCGLTVTYLG